MLQELIDLIDDILHLNVDSENIYDKCNSEYDCENKNSNTLFGLE